MKVSILKKIILDDKLGRLTYGQVVELPDHKAEFYLARGDAEIYDTKVFVENTDKVFVDTKELPVLAEKLDLNAKRKVKTKKDF